MSSLSIVTDRAVNNFSDNYSNAVFDPAMIFMIFEVISELVAMFDSCDKNASDATQMAQNPSRLQKRLVAIKVRRKLGRRDYRQYGSNAVKSILEAGKTTNEAEMTAVYDEITELDD